jgi:hypothetical protein
MVMLRPQGDSQAKTVLITGRIPFAAEVSPSLPPGLRFEVKYEQEFLEGGIPTVYYTFRVWLRGNPNALHRIRSVEYRLPEVYFSTTRIRAHSIPSTYRWRRPADYTDIVAITEMAHHPPMRFRSARDVKTSQIKNRYLTIRHGGEGFKSDPIRSPVLHPAQVLGRLDIKVEASILMGADRGIVIFYKKSFCLTFYLLVDRILVMSNEVSDKILDVALDYIMGRGYKAFSYKDISKEIGIKTSSIHYYFPTKGDLGKTLAQRFFQYITEAVELIDETTEDPKEKIKNSYVFL